MRRVHQTFNDKTMPRRILSTFKKPLIKCYCMTTLMTTILQYVYTITTPILILKGLVINAWSYGVVMQRFCYTNVKSLFRTVWVFLFSSAQKLNPLLTIGTANSGFRFNLELIKSHTFKTVILYGQAITMLCTYIAQVQAVQPATLRHFLLKVLGGKNSSVYHNKNNLTHNLLLPQCIYFFSCILNGSRLKQIRNNLVKGLSTTL